MIKRQELINAFKALMPGVDSTNTTTMSDIFIFDSKWVKTGNTKISISYPFPSDTGVEGGVKARELYKILLKMSDEAVTLALEEGVLLLKDSVTNLKLNVVQDETTDRIIGNKKLKRIAWEEIPSNFLKSINLCMFSTSPDQNSGVWNTVYINGKDMVSTDNVRVSWARLKAKMDEFMIPLSSIVEVLKLSPTHYSIDSTWAHFKNEKEGVILSARKVIGDYPIEDLKELFERETDSKEYSFPEDLAKSLNRVSILSYKDGYIELSYDDKNGYLVVKGEREFASIKDKIKISRGSFPANKKMHISPDFLNDILPRTRSFKISGNVVLFEIENYKHLIALYVPDKE